jgi:hypothetical protein
MAVMLTPQEHIETRGSSIDDTLTPANHDGNAVDLADSIDYLASQFASILGETNWHDSPDKTIAALAAQQTFEDTLGIVCEHLIADITIPATQNFKILTAASELPASKNKSIAASTLGLVTAQHTGTFGTHALDERAGDNALSPLNLVMVIDGSTGDPILSAGRRIYALLQHEATAGDGTAFTDTTPERAQVSFVRPNATYDDLEACPVADIENQVVNLKFPRQKYLSQFTKQEWGKVGVFADFPDAAAVGVTLDNAIDNQGTTPATQDTDVFWRISDDDSLHFQTSDGGRDLLAILPSAGGDELEVNVDTLDINIGAAGVMDVDNGATFDSGGQSINVGVTAGQIDSTTLELASTTGDLTLDSADDILFETVREASLPLDDATAGAISALPGGPYASISAAILGAINSGFKPEFKIYTAGAGFAQGANVPAASLDLTTYNIDMDVAGYANAPLMLFLNGRILHGVDVATQGDVYPGDTPASGDVKFDFPKGIKTGDILMSFGWTTS